MSKKTPAANKNAATMSDEDATALFWKILKKGDAGELEDFLFTKKVDDATGAITFIRSPKAAMLCNSRNVKQLTPLCFVVDNGMEDLIAVLVRAGAKIDAVDGTKEKRAPLHSAVAGEDDVMVQNLLRCGANVAAVDGEGRNALHIAARMGSRAIFGFILQLSEVPLEDAPLVDGIDIAKVDAFQLMEVQDNSGASPVHYALGELAGGDQSIQIATLTLDFLLREQKKSAEHQFRVKRLLQSKTRSGCTPLHCLAASGVSDSKVASMVKKLVEMGSSAAITDNNGQHALHYVAATPSKNADVFAAIVQALDSEELRRAVGKSTSGGVPMTALEVAVSEHNRAVVEWVAKHEERLTFLRSTAASADGDVLCQLAVKALPSLRDILVNAKLVDHEAVAKLVAEDETDDNDDEESQEGDAAHGDYSGHGSSTFAGSRVQQARRAAHQKRKETADERSSTRKQVEDNIAAATQKREELQKQKNGLGFGAKVLIAVLMLSMLIPLLDFVLGKKR